VSKLVPHVYFVGTAGSGKSSLAGAYHEWCKNHGLDTVLVNLDPGAERLPYQPDVDVRDWIKLTDLMTQDGLGPNGAQIAASDLLAMQADKIRDAIDGFRPEYVLIDTPGQIELFVFRQSGRFLTQFLAPERSLVAYLVDPVLAKEPSSFVSQLMLAASIHFRLGLPMAYVLSKADLLSDEDRDRIMEWAEQPDALMAAVRGEEATMYQQLNADILQALEAMSVVPNLHPVSAADVVGVEDLYAMVQLHFSGGEDVTADSVDPGDLIDRA
jgi:hypothetical protein